MLLSRPLLKSALFCMVEAAKKDRIMYTTELRQISLNCRYCLIQSDPILLVAASVQ